MLERDFTYLAVPYMHEDPAVKERRFRKANVAAGFLMSIGHTVYSPISHCHPIAKAVSLPVGWEFWRHMDEVYLRHSRQIVVLTLEGWVESKGVRGELEIAKGLGLPVIYMAEGDRAVEAGTATTFDLSWSAPL